MRLSVGEIEHPRMGGDMSDETLINPQSCLMNGGWVQAFRREELEYLASPHDVDGTNLRRHLIGDHLDQLIETFLCTAMPGHDGAHAA